MGAVMVIDEGRSTIPYGMIAAAGRPAESIHPFHFVGWDELHPGGWDARARIEEQDRDGVTAEILYPSVGMLLCNHPDAAYKKACFDAYNGWITEFQSFAPTRLIGLGQSAALFQGVGAEQETAKGNTAASVASLVDGDCSKPRQKWPVRVVAPDRDPSRDEGLVRGLVGFVRIAGVAPDQAVERLLVPPHQVGEGAFVALRRVAGEFGVGGSITEAHEPSAVSDLTTVSSNCAAWAGARTPRMAMTWSIVSACSVSEARWKRSIAACILGV